MYAGDHTKGNCRKTTLPAQQLNGQNEESEHQYPEEAQANSNDLSESSPEISTCESDSSYPRFVLITFNMAIQVKIYRRWTSKHIRTQTPTNFCCIMLGLMVCTKKIHGQSIKRA